MTLFPIAGESEIKGGMIAVGASFTAAGLFGLLFGPLTGRMSDLHGRTRLMLFGALLTACEGGALLLTRSPWIIGAAFALGGIGAAAFINSFHATIGDLSVARTRGVITGFAGLARESGGIAGSLLAPWLWTMTDLYYPFGLQILFTGLALILVICFSRYKTSRPSHPAEISEAIVSS
jgi:DHA1 family multidrug resistance protein-like MFS transporter